MNRVLKKAVSFFTAMAVSTSMLAAASISASAASAVSAKQTLKNSYELALSFDSGAFFATDIKSETMEYTTAWGDTRTEDIILPEDGAKFYMITSKGKKVQVKNTIGFDKVYSLNTGGGPEMIFADWNFKGSAYDTNDGNAVVVGKGDKYAVILSTGKFLAKGKLFDTIVVGNEYITATVGKYTYFYNVTNGKQLAKIKSTTIGICAGYDKSSKTFLTYKGTTVENSWGYDYHLVKGGKIKKSFTSDKYSSVYFVKSGSKNVVCAATKDWPRQYEYYTMAGKKTTIKDNDKEINLTPKCEFDWEARTGRFTVTDSKGKEILAYDTTVYPPDKGDPIWIRNNGKLIIAYDIFCIIDEATGKIETKTEARGYTGINTISSSNTSFVLDLATQVNGDEYTYFKYSKVVTSSNGKELSFNGYKLIYPVEYDGKIGTDFYTYNKDVAFVASYYDEEYDQTTYALLNNKGNPLMDFYYDGVRSTYKAAALMGGGTICDIVSCKNGKVIKKDVQITNRNVNNFVKTSSNRAYLITTNSDGTKYGCIVVKG